MNLTENQQVIIPAGSQLASLNGGTVSTVINSTFVPQLNPVSAIFIVCNVAKYEVPINGSAVIAVFTNHGVAYGIMITIEPSQVDMYDIDTN